MAKIYVKQILDGKRTIEEVPELWRDAVLKLLEEQGNQ